MMSKNAPDPSLAPVAATTKAKRAAKFVAELARAELAKKVKKAKAKAKRSAAEKERRRLIRAAMPSILRDKAIRTAERAVLMDDVVRNLAWEMRHIRYARIRNACNYAGFTFQMAQARTSLAKLGLQQESGPIRGARICTYWKLPHGPERVSLWETLRARFPNTPPTLEEWRQVVPLP